MEAILIGLAILIAWTIIAPTGRRLWRQYYRDYYAFTFETTGPFQGQKMIQLPIGQSSFLLWAKHYNDTELDGFTVRFVPTKKTGWKDKQVPASIISIKKANLKWDTTDEIIKRKAKHTFEEEMPIRPSEPSKWTCKFNEVILRGPKLPIGIKIMVEAKESWTGYFSIESRPQRQYGRIKVKITDR